MYISCYLYQNQGQSHLVCLPSGKHIFENTGALCSGNKIENKTHISILLIYIVHCIIILCITKANIKRKVNVLSN